MAQTHQTTEREWPGIDPIMVRLTLQALAELYGERIALASSGSERGALAHQYAVECSRELAGLNTEEARVLRALFAAIAEGTPA